MTALRDITARKKVEQEREEARVEEEGDGDAGVGIRAEQRHRRAEHPVALQEVGAGGPQTDTDTFPVTVVDKNGMFFGNEVGFDQLARAVRRCPHRDQFLFLQ